MTGTIRCFVLSVGEVEIAMRTSDIAELRSRALGPSELRPSARSAWMETADDGGTRLVFDLTRILFPGRESRPTRAVVLVPEAVPEGLRRSFSARAPGRSLECAFLCDRVDRELEIDGSLLKPLPKVIRAEGILGAFAQAAFFDGTAYFALDAMSLIEKVVRFRRSLP